MKSKVFTIMVVGVVLGCLALPAMVLTAARPGVVMNRRTRVVYQGLTPLTDAMMAAWPNDVLLASGNITEATDILFGDGATWGFTGTIVGEGRVAYAANITLSGGCPPNIAVLDLTNRGGPVTLTGLNINVPDGCQGIYSDGTGSNGTGITVRNCKISGKPASAIFHGIHMNYEYDGPFNFSNNTITGHLDGIWLQGDGVTTIAATIEKNKITDTTGATGVGYGIEVWDVPAGSAVVVQRNTVDGGGSGGIGIQIDTAEDVIVQKNTVKNYSEPTSPGWGINVDDGSLNCQVLRNKLQNNAVGIVVDPSGSASTGTVVNYNNILGNPATQVGLDFDSAPNGTYNLDATKNYWNASTGPNSVNNPSSPPPGDCPEASGSSCTGPGGGGTGMPVSAPNFATSECGAGVSEVTTCLFKTVSILGAGA